MTDITKIKSHLLPLQELHFPEPPSFWPLPWGWWTLLAAVLLTILLIVAFIVWRVRRVKAKKAAIALLELEKATISPSGAMEIVRQAVLSYYPRSRVSHLSGESWLTFLDSQVKGSIFCPHEETWLMALYQKDGVDNREELVSQCAQWLNSALPPKRGGRG